MTMSHGEWSGTNALIQHIRADMALRAEVGFRVAEAITDENVGTESDRHHEVEQRAITAVVTAAVRLGEAA